MTKQQKIDYLTETLLQIRDASWMNIEMARKKADDALKEVNKQKQVRV